MARSTVRSPQQLTRRQNRELIRDANSKTLTAKWTSGSAPRSRHNNHLDGVVNDIPSLASSRRYVMTPAATSLRMDVERISRTTGQMQTRRATQTAMEEADVIVMDGVELQSGTKICLGAFGDVGKMTVKTVDFLIHVLEDRKQELVMNGKDKKVKGRASDAADKDETSEERQDLSASNVARLQLNSTSNDGAHVTELVRSHSYEALVQLEEILDARHNRLMNDGILESTDDICPRVLE